MTFAIAAAGTGGHVYPALAVAAALGSRGVDARHILFLGGDRIEAKAVPAAGYSLLALDIRGLRRSLSMENLTLPLSVRRAAREAGAALERAGTKAVAVFGGYVTGPAVMAARKRRLPIVIHEQNAVPGIANRLASRYATRTFLAFEPAAEILRHGEVVGNPLRTELADFDRSRLIHDARRHFGLTGTRPVLGVLGGSQGASVLNEAVASLLQDPNLDIEVIHLTGAAHIDHVLEAAENDDRWRPLGYENRMDLFYAAADLVVSRAGALTMSELAATATPAVVVPLPAGKGYQARNAADLVTAGGSIMVGQERIHELPTVVGGLLRDRDERERMGKAAGSVGLPNAADVVAEALMELIDGG